MEAILRGYEVNEPTWFYLSLLLILAVFFRFSRLLCLRNCDLALVLAFAPGLLFVRAAPEGSPVGYIWLFVTTFLLLIRLLLDPVFTRRPWIEPNLNPAGLAFLCVSAFLFEATRVFTVEPHESTIAAVRRADDMLKRHDRGEEPEETRDPEAIPSGPAPALLVAPVVPLVGGVETTGARVIAVLSHLSVVLGLLAVGRWHFGDVRLGLAMSTLYLLLPPTAYDVSRATHVLPSALIIWAFALYRRPWVAGILLGLACGSLFFAVFLLPVWIAFYWRRGAGRFALAQVLVAAVLLGTLLMTSADSLSLKRQIMGTIDWSALKFDGEHGGVGFWSLYDPAYRIPVFALFAVMVSALTLWPSPKTPEHLLAHSTAIVAATQFWYTHQGGVYVLWYLPLFLMVLFRPKLANLPAPGSPPVPAPPAQQSTAAERSRGSGIRGAVWR